MYNITWVISNIKMIHKYCKTYMVLLLLKQRISHLIFVFLLFSTNIVEIDLCLDSNYSSTEVLTDNEKKNNNHSNPVQTMALAG